MSSLIFEALWRDRGVAAGLKGLGKDADASASKFGKMSTTAKIGMLAAGAAVLKFGVSSVKAYTEAETSQAKLAFAFQKFPKLADTNQASLQKLNSALQLKTKFDDDAIASGQAVLAQYDLTGKQLENVTPLLLDYAAKTGKDLPAAASAMGKAFMGNTRALKEIGINYKSTGDQAQDFANITALMRQQVGGFAANEGKTAAGQFAILKNQIGELQEAAGKELLPAVISVTKALTAGVQVVGQYSNVLLPVGAGLAVVATAVWGADKALKAWAVTQAVVSKMGPKTSASFTSIGTAAAAAGVALLAVAAGSEALNRLGTQVKPVSELETSLSKLASGQAELNDVFSGANWADELQGLLTTGITPARDLQSALKGLEVTQTSSLGKFQRWRESITPGTQSLEKAEQQVGALDGALASMVSKGNGEQAAAALQKMGVSSEQVARFFPQYSAALKNSTTANAGAAGAMSATEQAASEQAAAVKEATEAMYAQANAALALSGSQIGVEAAMDAARNSAKENGKTLDVNTEKGRANKQALNSLASATLEYTSSLVESGAGAEKVAAANERGRSSFIKSARAMGASKSEATALANSLFKIPDSVRSQIVVAGGKVSAKQATDLNKALKGIPKEQRARIVTIANTKGAKAAAAEIKKVKDKNAKIKFETDAKKRAAEANRESAKTQNRKRDIKYDTNAKRTKDQANREAARARSVGRDIKYSTNARARAADASRAARGADNVGRNIRYSHNGGSAASAASAAAARARNIHRTITYTRKGGPTASANAYGGKIGFADGGSPRLSRKINQGTYAARADDVEALLSRNEWVIQAPSAKKYGDAAMAAVNAGTAKILFGQGGSPGGGRVGDLVSAGRGGGVTVINHYIVNAPNYVGPQRELMNALSDAARQNRIPNELRRALR